MILVQNCSKEMLDFVKQKFGLEFACFVGVGLMRFWCSHTSRRFYWWLNEKYPKEVSVATYPGG